MAGTKADESWRSWLNKAYQNGSVVAGSAADAMAGGASFALRLADSHQPAVDGCQPPVEILFVRQLNHCLAVTTDKCEDFDAFPHGPHPGLTVSMRVAPRQAWIWPHRTRVVLAPS